MNKIITSFEKYNESKHATTIADAKDAKDEKFLEEAKKVLADAKKYKLSDADTRSEFGQLQKDIKVLAKCIADKHKSSVEQFVKKVKAGIKNCNFK